MEGTLGSVALSDNQQVLTLTQGEVTSVLAKIEGQEKPDWVAPAEGETLDGLATRLFGAGLMSAKMAGGWR